jgi:Sep-tRNA:Cys-tRNA synthetase
MKAGFGRYLNLRNEYADKIIINPIMTGGIIPIEVREKLLKDGWLTSGYTLCFNCIEGRSGSLANPPVREFLSDVAKFYGGDLAEHTFGCRSAQFIVFKTIADFVYKEGSKEYVNIAIVDPLCHYTTAIAAEATNFKLKEAAHSGYPDYITQENSFVERIEAVRKETGKLPGLIVVTHADPYYGNLSPVISIGKIAQDYGVPYMVNAAYTGGVMPINLRELQADFLTISAHKSMSSLGPLGFLVTHYEWGQRVFKTSAQTMEWSGRTFGKKIPNLLGCSIGGVPLISAMLSFPHVVKRVNEWEEEIKKTRWLIERLEEMRGVMVIGERPHRHHLIHVETPIFWEISKHHKRRGFFLAEEMEKQGIVGLHKGLTRHIKLSVYSLSWEEVKRVRDAFYDVAETYTKKFNIMGTLGLGK